MTPRWKRAFAATIALVTPACTHIDGTLTSTATPLGTWTFQPTRCTIVTTSPDRIKLSSHADPLRYVVLSRAAAEVTGASGAAAPSVLATRSAPSFELTILDLAAGDGAPLVIPSSKCRALALRVSPSSSSQQDDGHWVHSFKGTAEIDCPYPDDAHRFSGRFDFDCPNE